MINYPFIKCLHPKRIVNPYTHEAITVPCGHCEACRLNKHNRLTFQCKLESVTSGVPLFITLTYRNSEIPRATFVESLDTLGGYDLYDSETGEQLNSEMVTSQDVELLQKKFRLFGYCPYLRKSDLVKFIKRLRYYVTKNSTAKVRYFAVGEYGPVHFRPHYHILLWCSDSKVKSNLAEYIHSSWPFGLVDCQLSQGDSAKYVAGYVNSFGSIPKVLASPSTCPFVLHSTRLGQGFLQGQRKTAYEIAPSDFIRQCLRVDGRNTEFNLWRSCYAYFYPKCRGFAGMSKYRCARTYSSYRILQEVFRTKDTQELAEITALLCVDYYSTEHSLHSLFYYYDLTDKYYQSYIADLLEYFADGIELSSVENCHQSFTRLVQRIYRDLSISRHFLDFCCDHKVGEYPTFYEVQRKVEMIQLFYRDLDYMHLTDFFEAQRLYHESDLFVLDELVPVSSDNSVVPLFYDNFDSDFSATLVYQRYYADVMKTFKDSTKHKKLNDLNQLLFN